MIMLWRKWQKTYLWQQQYSRLESFPNPPTLEVGQIVHVKAPGLLFGEWQLARIVDIHRGNDGLIRRVAVRFPSGAVVIRHISHIALLETDIPEEEEREERQAGAPPAGLTPEIRDRLAGGEQRRMSERLRERRRLGQTET